MRRFLLFPLAFFVSGCLQDSVESEIRLIEIHVDQAEPLDIDALTLCLEQDSCEDRTLALTEVAISELSELGQSACKWEVGTDGLLRPVKVDDAEGVEDVQFTLGDLENFESDDFVAKLQASLATTDDNFTCDFDNKLAEFSSAYERLEAAASDGSHDAANELALLHIDDPDLHDLTLARAILEPCNAQGGGFCAFNLARLESLEADDGCGPCIRWLRIAGARTADPGIRFMYAKAKRVLGRGAPIETVFFDQDADAGVQTYIAEFNTLFPRLADE